MEIAARLKKSDIAELSRIYGGRNTKEYRGHAPGTLVYKTFAGAIDLVSGEYVGAHIIEVSKTPPKGTEAAFDFHMLPVQPVPPHKVKKK